VHILLISLFQIPFISSDFIQNTREVFGVFNLRDLHWNLHDVSLVVGWGSAVLLFILVYIYISSLSVTLSFQNSLFWLHFVHIDFLVVIVQIQSVDVS
jgi:hypothetical protein